MKNVLPLFRSQYSVGRSILTLAAPDKDGKLDENYPVSIFDIAKKHGLDQVPIVDTSISGFLEAHQNAKKAGVKLVYGVQLRCMENILVKNDDSLKTVSKIIVFMRNTAGYADLIKITSRAAREGFYYHPNIDFENLKALWTDNLLLAIPFYDSFLFANALLGFRCVPNFSFTKPVFFIENSGLPFDSVIQRKVAAYARETGFSILPARSIYYYKRDDFLTYLTFRCIHGRTSLSAPQLDHMSSDMFSFETWQQQDSNPQSVILC